NRLIQGDVGCGKTVVALYAMLVACGSGYQAALMVPTEILAEQHYLTLRGLIHALGLQAVLLRSGGSPKARAAVRAQIEAGQAHIVIGTHALIQKGVRFAQLGLAVIDEQHKFGVLQAAIQGAERLQAQGFRSVRVGLRHGRMKTEEKERTMAAFKKGEIPILVATTVIEVGVDIPNATVMLVEHAERFGLAQLHQ